MPSQVFQPFESLRGEAGEDIFHVQIFVHINILTYKYSYIQIFVHIFILTYNHSYIINTNILTYNYSYIQLFLHKFFLYTISLPGSILVRCCLQCILSFASVLLCSSASASAWASLVDIFLKAYLQCGEFWIACKKVIYLWRSCKMCTHVEKYFGRKNAC